MRISTMSNVSRIAAVVGGLVLLIFLGLVGYAAAPYVFGDAGANSEAAALERMSREINTDLPTQIDTGTRLESTSVDNETLQYNYTLLPAVSDDLDMNRFVADYTDPIRQTVCSKPRLRALLRRGFDVAYRYRLEDGTSLGEFVFSTDDCAK